MEWTRLDVDGRVTALRRGLCAGVGYDGRAFTCDLRTLEPTPVSYDGIMLDSFGVVGASPGVDAWLTGRTADGRLHLIGARPEFVGTAGECIEHSLEDIGAMWASPVLDARASYLLASDLQDGTWRLRTPGPGPGLIVTLEPVTTDPCDHRFQAKGHDPGVRLRHLSQVRHATCTSPVCRRPAAQCDHEHNIPYEAGGRTCLCNTGPKCRHDHRLKQHPKWRVEQLPDGTFRWTTPSGRSYDTEPTRYHI